LRQIGRARRAKTKDVAQFSGWLKEESAFSKLRGMAEFRAILEALAQH
jgi:hypothetical protein